MGDLKLSDLLRADTVAACFVEYAHPPIDEMDKRTVLALELEQQTVSLQQRVEALERFENAITRNGTLLPVHFMAWADSIREQFDYGGSSLEVHLRELAEALAAAHSEGQEGS